MDVAEYQYKEKGGKVFRRHHRLWFCIVLSVILCACIVASFIIGTFFPDFPYKPSFYRSTKSFVDDQGQYRLTLYPDGRALEDVTLRQCLHEYTTSYRRSGHGIYLLKPPHDRYLNENAAGLYDQCGQLYDIDSPKYATINALRVKRIVERIQPYNNAKLINK